MHCLIENGGAPDWIGDGFCDDLNNNKDCEFDGGDCCGLSAKKVFCVKCNCIGKLECWYVLQIKKNQTNVFHLSKSLHVKMIGIVMSQMVIAMLESANAYQIMNLS